MYCKNDNILFFGDNMIYAVIVFLLIFFYFYLTHALDKRFCKEFMHNVDNAEKDILFYNDFYVTINKNPDGTEVKCYLNTALTNYLVSRWKLKGKHIKDLDVFDASSFEKFKTAYYDKISGGIKS